MNHVIHFNFWILDHRMEQSSGYAIRFTICEDEDVFKVDWLVIVIKTGEHKKTVTSGDLWTPPSLGWELRLWAHIIRKFPWQREEKNWKMGSRSPVISNRFDFHTPPHGHALMDVRWTINIINHLQIKKSVQANPQIEVFSSHRSIKVHLMICCDSFKHPTRVTLYKHV